MKPTRAFFAEYRAHYPTDLWFDPRQYATRDGYVPFRVFWAYYAEISPAHAMERLNVAMGVGHALERAFAKEGEPMNEALRTDLERAYQRPKDSSPRTRSA